MRISLETLGCKLNQAETELLARELAAAGHEIVSASTSGTIGTADVGIVTTCTVTGPAARKSRQLLQASRRRNPRALVVATACYAARAAARRVAGNGRGEWPDVPGRARPRSGPERSEVLSR